MFAAVIVASQEAMAVLPGAMPPDQLRPSLSAMALSSLVMMVSAPWLMTARPRPVGRRVARETASVR